MVSLTREDVERIVSNVIAERGLITVSELKQQLSVRVKNGYFTDPNSRTVEIYLDGDLITSDSFDVSSRPDYEG